MQVRDGKSVGWDGFGLSEVGGAGVGKISEIPTCAGRQWTNISTFPGLNCYLLCAEQLRFSSKIVITMSRCRL